MIRFGAGLALVLLLTPLGAVADESAPPFSIRPPGLSPPSKPPRGGDAVSPGRADPGNAGDSKQSEPAPHSRADTLNELYARLAASKDAEETAGIIAAIDRLALESGSDAGDLLMSRAIGAMSVKKYDVALALLDKLVDLQPEWAEAWNKRATVRFLADDDRGSMADIAHVLKIEPRHVGALSGMGMILEREGFRDDALRAYRRALAIAPQLDSLKTSVDRLTKAVQGEDL
jgi:tetratricopeptide (TPR) repeat protein